MKFLKSALFLALATCAMAQPQPATLHWQPWSDAAFAQAKQQHKFVLLDLEAVWCHWCHVMDDITYKDPVVIRLLNEKYILVKVDQDSRPDISNRYQDYGWPATVVFAADGSEIVKRQGYIPPRPMSSMLQAIIKDPSPGPSIEREAAFHAAPDASMAPALLASVKKSYDLQYDKPNGGWGFSHKYLDGDSVEEALRLAAAGNADSKQRAQTTLHDALALLDPVWGGAYQYSVGGHWSEPHFEKLIFIQAAFLREYSLAYAQSGQPEDLAALQSVHNYITNFLEDKPTGVFFVSQDADLHDGEDNETYFKQDDAHRRGQGVPRVDKHVYARENGWMIAALCDYYAVTGDASALDQAKRATAWIVMHRSITGGGFRHDDVDAGGPYLADSLAMGRAFLALWNVTGDRQYLDNAEQSAKFMQSHFAPRKPGAGYITSAQAANSGLPTHADRDENIALARFASTLHFVTKNDQDQAMAAEAMRYLASPAIATRPLSAGILLAHDDFINPPLHVTVVGGKSDPQAAALHNAALRSLVSHEVIEWRDPADRNPLPTEVSYPKLAKPALFLCTATSCSSPTFEPRDVAAKVRRAQLAHASAAN